MTYYSKTNVAYDFSRFAPEEVPEEERQEQKEVEVRKVKSPSKSKYTVSKRVVKPASVVKWVFICIFIMLSLASIMIGNIRITQLNDKITSAQKTLDTAKSEQVYLNSQLESRMSMTKVEDYAINKLGLVKIQPYQIQYVHLKNTDNVEITDNAADVENFFKNLFYDIMEYFQ